MIPHASATTFVAAGRGARSVVVVALVCARQARLSHAGRVREVTSISGPGWRGRPLVARRAIVRDSLVRGSNAHSERARGRDHDERGEDPTHVAHGTRWNEPGDRSIQTATRASLRETVPSDPHSTSRRGSHSPSHSDPVLPSHGPRRRRGTSPARTPPASPEVWRTAHRCRRSPASKRCHQLPRPSWVPREAGGDRRRLPRSEATLDVSDDVRRNTVGEFPTRSRLRSQATSGFLMREGARPTGRTCRHEAVSSAKGARHEH